MSDAARAANTSHRLTATPPRAAESTRAAQPGGHLNPGEPGPWRAALAGLLGLALTAGACQQGTPGGSARSGPGGPVPVSVASAVRKDVPVVVRSVGNVESVGTVEVASQVTGLVLDVHFKEGDFVKRGDLLFTIDTRPYSSTLAAAQAQLARDQALYQQAVDEAERAVRLNSEGLASEQDLTRAKSNAAAAAAALGADKAQIGSARIDVQFTRIRAPIDGRTGSLLVYPGNVVRSNESRPLVVIRSLVPIYVRFSIPEDYLPRLRMRMKEGDLPAFATPRGEGGATVEGRVSFIDNWVDPATGTIALKALFTNRDHELWPGEFVDVALTLAVDQDATVVPEAALQTGQDGPYVFSVGADGKATYRSVVLKHIVGPEAVLASGVEPGEQVVIDGQVRLRDGTPVTARPSAPGPAAGGSASTEASPASSGSALPNGAKRAAGQGAP